MLEADSRSTSTDGRKAEGKTFDSDVAYETTLTPDPSIADTLGRRHSLQTAISDLVDNSIDAGARNVRIRFQQTADAIIGMQIIDDGAGMTADTLHDAMIIGRRRGYSLGSLGHFGVGLKASSLSQAETLTVFSRSALEAAAAIRMRKTALQRDFTAEVLKPDAAIKPFTTDYDFPLATGTVVQWSEPAAFPTSDDVTVRSEWLEQTVTDLAHCLGLVFHRLVADGRITIAIEIEDAETLQTGVPRAVEAIDPFHLRMEGQSGFPKRLHVVDAGGAGIGDLECHILPPKSSSGHTIKIHGRPRADWQGLYIYRGDRLLQAGGWCELVHPSPDFQLARVAIDLTPELERSVIINSEKDGVALTPDFRRAVENAVADDGSDFREYLDTAADLIKNANKRISSIKPVTPVGKGVPPSVRREFENNVGFRADTDPVDIRWRKLEEGRFFRFDLEERCIWLNQRYRRGLTGDDHAGFNDLPLMKSLVFMLLEEHFKRGHLRQTTAEQIEIKQQVLATALMQQLADIEAVRVAGHDEELQDAPVGQQQREWSAEEDVTLLETYKSEHSIQSVADATGLDLRQVAIRLVRLLLLQSGEVDDESLAPRHGLHYDSDEREKLLRAYKAGEGLSRIAERHQRTPLAIGWQLLDSPEQPVKVTKQLLRIARRRLHEWR